MDNSNVITLHGVTGWTSQHADQIAMATLHERGFAPIMVDETVEVPTPEGAVPQFDVSVLVEEVW